MRGCKEKVTRIAVIWFSLVQFCRKRGLIMTEAERYRERVFGAVADYHEGRKVSPSFCEKCGSYLKPEQTKLCDNCREPKLFNTDWNDME